MKSYVIFTSINSLTNHQNYNTFDFEVIVNEGLAFIVKFGILQK